MMRQVDGFALWLGHVGDARDLRQLLETGIEAVVDLARNEPPVVLTRELVYCRFPLIDGADNPPWMLRGAVETVAGLIRAKVPTLVYCSAGMSRTPSIAAAAIGMVSGMTPEKSLTVVTQSGTADVSPVLWAAILAAII